MRYSLLFVLLFILNSNLPLLAQTCAPGTQLDYLFGNQVNTAIGTSGDLFWDGSDGQFFAPSEYGNPDPVPSTFFAAGIWLGGFDGSGNLKLAAQTYRQSGNDFWPGPIDDVTGSVFENDCAQFDRLWRVPGYAVEQHLADLQDGTIDLPVDQHLKEWPAKGNPFFLGIFGFDLPAQDLAPFHDFNADGNYNPEDGDYPVIDPTLPNVVASDLLWTVFNDVGNIHSESNGDRLNVEVHLTAYAFDCATDSILDRTIFTRHKIINKNETVFTDLYMGAWADPDLGCWDDDFIGSAPDLNSFFAYNSTNDDADCADFAGGIIKGYGLNPPVQSVTFLNEDMAAYVFYNNDGTPTGNPNQAQEYYRYMQGQWRDGSPVEYGGDGFMEGTFATPFMFPSDPNSTDTGVWSEVSENNTGYDRRGVGSTGPFVLPAQAALTIDMAYSFHRDLTRTNLGNVTLMYENVQKIQEIYDNNFSATGACSLPLCLDDCVWPGDTDADGKVTYLDLLNIGVANASNGVQRPNALIWSPYTVTDWSTTFPDGLDYKHADCDGNGLVGEADLAILDLNYGSLNSSYDGSTGNDDISDQLTMETVLQVPAVGMDTVCPGTLVAVQVNIGANAAVENIHGLGFTIGTEEYLARAIQGIFMQGIGGLDDDETAITYIKETHPDNYRTKYEAATTRLDGVEKSLSGDLFYFRFEVADDIFDYLPANDPYLRVTIDNIRAVSGDGTEVFLGSQTYSMYVKNKATGTKDLQAAKLLVMPNPANDFVQISLEQGKAEQVLLHDGLGRLVYEKQERAASFQIDLKNLPAGIYYLSVATAKGWAREKICITH